ncbi:hypothetical protein LTR08_004478 [Meristemomyces frigidus]|nr:hypothetical protein LTR08_004478 [Meristemomyces frigidus]
MLTRYSINFAFAYIDPQSYEIVTMDTQTPASLFTDITNVKSVKPSLEIAADAGKRQKFANNVVKFMRQYGFDGLDIDWEYPGAPDRGGDLADTKNYVSLMQTLRSTFDSSGGREIKLAADLFWRVGVSPADIVLGFGFYGRSFTLSDPSCNTPGCPFSGASNPGPCTVTGGILGYYEIMQVLKQNPSITPTHDTTNGVMYFTFNKNQWVSFDNQATFKQKVDWANGVGLGGAMVWASDLDDDRYTAHSALLGRKVTSTSALQLEDKALSNPQAVISSLASDNGQNCFAYKGKCVNLNDNNAMQAACGAGNTVIGWDDAGCGTKKCHCGKPICCPTNATSQQCKWRGDDNGSGASSDCSAQCAAGEINIKGVSSSYGGGFLNDGNTNKCARGFKVFCCPDPEYLQLTQGCNYAGWLMSEWDKGDIQQRCLLCRNEPLLLPNAERLDRLPLGYQD